MTLGGLLLAAVLATAGVTKLLDLEGSRRAVANFGVRPAIAGPLGTLLPVAELGIAAALAAAALSSAPARVGGWSAFVLLAAFSAAITVSLARGQAPDCHCFGQLHSAPAGPRTLARNGALLTLAGFVGSGGEPAATVLAAVVALAMPAAALPLVRRQAIEDERAHGEGLPAGTPAPDFELSDPTGQVHTLDSLRAGGRPVLLLFSDPNCGPCTALAPDVARWQRDHADELTVAVIERDGDRGDPTAPDEHGRQNVLLQRQSEVADLYRAQGTPSAVLIGRDGAIASPVAAGGDQIEALIGSAVDGLASGLPGALPVLPGFALPLRRREIIVRAGTAWAATSAIISWPLRAVAVASGRTSRAAGPRCRDKFDCPDRDGFARCVDGRCQCRFGATYCSHDDATDKHCFNLRLSRDHCGRCNNACTGANRDTCCEGECGEFGQTRCNCGDSGRCPGEHDICGNDPGNPSFYFCFPCADFGWKRCGNECADPAVFRCCGGKLYRKADLGPGDWRCCGPRHNRRLINVDRSPNHCNGCNKPCARGQVCDGGRCRNSCPGGRRRCGGTCIDPRTEYCCGGRVGQNTSQRCGPDCHECVSPLDTCCNGQCVNTDFDHRHCGGCGNFCPSPCTCQGGDRGCVCPEPARSG